MTSTRQPIPFADLGTLKNELRKYKHGRKLTIAQFDQAARLAWLGKITLAPLDPEDPECKAWLLHLEPPEGLAATLLEVDEALLARIHVLDAEQGEHLASILRDGFESRAADLQQLARREFYLERFMRKESA